MSEAPTTHSPGAMAASRALFARVSRKSHVVAPLNASAADPTAQGPAIYCVHSISGAGGADFLALWRHLGASTRMFDVQVPPKRMEEPAFGADVPALGAITHGLRARGREIGFLAAVDGGSETQALLESNPLTITGDPWVANLARDLKAGATLARTG